jgi:hypothetical protein
VATELDSRGFKRKQVVAGQIPIRYVDPEQDAKAVQAIAREAARILAPGEEIIFIAAENRTAMSVKRDSVVITTTRIIAIRPGPLARVAFHDYPWHDVLDVCMKEGMLSTEIVIETSTGQQQVGWVASEQAKRLYEIARQIERDWRERRRIT